MTTSLAGPGAGQFGRGRLWFLPPVPSRAETRQHTRPSPASRLWPAPRAGNSLSPCWKITSLPDLPRHNLRLSPRPVWRPWTLAPHRPRVRPQTAPPGGFARSRSAGVSGWPRSRYGSKRSWRLAASDRAWWTRGSWFRSWTPGWEAASWRVRSPSGFSSSWCRSHTWSSRYWAWHLVPWDRTRHSWRGMPASPGSAGLNAALWYRRENRATDS